MKAPYFLKTSFQTRLIAAIAFMFLPIAALTFSSLYLPQRINDILTETMGTTTRHIKRVTDLQIAALEAGCSLHQYLIYGHQDKREGFARLSQDIERDLNIIQALAHSTEEQTALAYAKEEWQQVRAISEKILALPHPALESVDWEEMKKLHGHVDSMLGFLHHLHLIAINESYAAEYQTIALVQRALPIAAATIGVAIVLAAVAVVILLYSVLTPIRALKQGTAQFSKGNLAHRVSITSGDEFGELAKAFNTMAESLERKEAALEEMATHDGLTGLYNSREFHRILEAEIERSRRYRHSLVLLIADIDHFKKVNDTYGHQAGDNVLRVIAGCMQKSIRKVDYAARFGGEEFAIILTEMTAAEAITVAERLRTCVSHNPITIIEEKSVSITISIGVAAFPEDADSSEKLVAAADQALYAAKASGRNRVQRAS